MSGQVESISGTFVRSPSDPAIVDGWGNNWTLSQDGQVVIDGLTDRSTAGVTELGYFNRQVWQWVQSKQLWWSKTSPTAPWMPPGGTPNAPFGPTPDPRIDTLQASVNALSTQLAQAIALVVGSVQAVANDVNAIPENIIPDPRIDALSIAVALNGASGAAAFATISGKIDALAAGVLEAYGGLQSQVDLLETQSQAIQAAQTAAAAQLERLIVMMLALSAPGQTQITTNAADLKVVGHQAAPLAPGP